MTVYRTLKFPPPEPRNRPYKTSRTRTHPYPWHERVFDRYFGFRVTIDRNIGLLLVSGLACAVGVGVAVSM